MKVKELLGILNDLTVGDLEKEVYIDLPDADEYKELEFCPVVDPEDEDVVVGFVISEMKPDTEVKLPFDGVH